MIVTINGQPTDLITIRGKRMRDLMILLCPFWQTVGVESPGSGLKTFTDDTNAYAVRCDQRNRGIRGGEQVHFSAKPPRCRACYFGHPLECENALPCNW